MKGWGPCWTREATDYSRVLEGQNGLYLYQAARRVETEGDRDVRAGSHSKEMGISD